MLILLGTNRTALRKFQRDLSAVIAVDLHVLVYYQYDNGALFRCQLMEVIRIYEPSLERSKES